ncbi:hypothetical protein AK830_g2771 [Neonectria ditissima]|uniref:NAD-dependent epimerase/dehydratase domain-containing protein n=1 Tax=Neonectria ditissima TaxID=78410 RepID=A0A0P7B1H1_9HYPO|nr:hypothetical protein AK830_g2771 [Neonectria ditissima]
MTRNLLITGAAGYMYDPDLPVWSIQNTLTNLFSAVDVANERAAKEAVLENEIDIILHTASSHEPHIVSHLIQALGQRRKITGKETYFIHTSGTTAFAPEAGWPSEEMKDTDPIFEAEKQISANHPIQLTDIQVIEEGKAHGVNTFIVVVPAVYGRGTGECKTLSIAFPAFIRASIKNKLVHRFDKNGSPAAAHISDITALYGLLVEQILLKMPIPSGEKGYYFAVAHKTSSWDFMQRLADRLYALGLVEEPEPHTWPSDELAAQSLGVPLQIVRIMGTHGTNLVPVNAYKLGWQPQWNEKMLLESVDDEIQAAREADS